MTTRYRMTAEQLLAQARIELEQGDLLQASEKSWGAAAQMMKAVAEARGWQHNKHALLFEVAARLAQEAGDDDIRRLFHAVGLLHTNFYENWLDRDGVAGGVRDAEELMRRVEPLLALA